MNSYKSNGIILRRNDYGEADRIYTVLTPERKVSAIAKGVRRKAAKLSSQLELFNEIELMFVVGKNLDIITSARTVDVQDLSVDYERMRIGFLFLEMTDRMTDTEGTEKVYELLRRSLEDISTVPHALCELRFKLQLLDALGHAPDMSSPDPLPSAIGLDIEHGVLSDANNPLTAALSQDEVKLWRLLLSLPLKDIASINGALAAAESSLPVADRFIQQQFGIRFKSAEI